MRNERGIMFPITVLLSCLFLLLVVHACALYEEELEFMKREEQSYDVDSLMQMAVHDLKTELQGVAPDVSAQKGTFVYPLGTAQYEWQRLDRQKVKIALAVTSNEGIRYSAECTVLLPDFALLEWSERY